MSQAPDSRLEYLATPDPTPNERVREGRAQADDRLDSQRVLAPRLGPARLLGLGLGLGSGFGFGFGFGLG